MPKSLFIIAMLMCFLQCSFSNEQQLKPIGETGKSFRVIGFYKGDGLDIEQYDLSKLTHLIFCFAYLDGNKISIKNESDVAILKQFVALKNKYPNLKVLISFGGWGGCETCSDVFSTETGRKEFVMSVKEMLEIYQADGIDLDWEIMDKRFRIKTFRYYFIHLAGKIVKRSRQIIVYIAKIENKWWEALLSFWNSCFGFGFYYR